MSSARRDASAGDVASADTDATRQWCISTLIAKNFLLMSSAQNGKALAISLHRQSFHFDTEDFTLH
jgi:hypothetical protein